MTYDNNLRGAIWKNKKKDTPKHPDFKGEAEIDGVQYWVSAWKRGENDNPQGPSLKFQFERKQAAPQAAPDASSPAGFDDDIPFMRLSSHPAI